MPAHLGPPPPGGPFRIRRAHVVALGVVTLVAWLPVLAFAAGFAVATATGCQVDEGSVHPCLVGGTDIGLLLYEVLVLGIIGSLVAGVPIMLTTLVWAGLALAWIVRRLRGTGRIGPLPR